MDKLQLMNLFIGIAGDGGLALTIIQLLAKDIKGFGEAAVFVMTEKLRVKCVELYNQWFPHLLPDQRPGLSLVVAGYTSSGQSNGKRAEIYSLNSFDNFAPRRAPTGFQAIGLSYLAHYILNMLYSPNVDVDNAAFLASFVIEETSSQDAKVGPEVQISAFSDSANYHEYTKTELDQVRQRCEKFREGMLDQIYGRGVPDEAGAGDTRESTEAVSSETA